MVRYREDCSSRTAQADIKALDGRGEKLCFIMMVDRKCESARQKIRDQGCVYFLSCAFSFHLHALL